MENKKEKFEYPELTLDKYDVEDIITISNSGGMDEDEDYGGWLGDDEGFWLSPDDQDQLERERDIWS